MQYSFFICYFSWVLACFRLVSSPFQLRSLLGDVLIHAIGRYKPTSPRRLWTLFITVCVALMFQSWALYIWATAPTFGPQESVHCSDQIKYIFVFVSVRATALWLRVLWMVVLGMEGIGILLYILLFLGMFMSKTKSQTSGGDSNSSQLKPSHFLLLL